LIKRLFRWLGKGRSPW